MKNQWLSFFRVLILLGLSPAIIKAQAITDSVIRLPVVEITDSSFSLYNHRSLIGRLQMEQSPSADIAEILRKQPNISGIRRGGYAVDPVIRGFRYSQLNIYLDDGIHIEGGCPNRMDPVLSHLVPEDIERIEIVRGPYQLMYGPSQAASVRVISDNKFLLKSKKTSVRSFTGYDANRGGIRQQLSISGSVNKILYKISGGIKDFGNYRDGNGKEWNSDYAGKNLSAAIGFRINHRDDLLLSYKGSYSTEVMFPALPMDEIADNTNIFSFRYKRNYPDRPENKVLISGFHTMVYHEMDNRFRPQYSQIVPPYTGLMQASAKVNTSVTGIRFDAGNSLGSVQLSYGIDGQYAFKDGTRHAVMIMQMNEQQYVSEKWTNLWKNSSILNSGFYAGLATERKKISLKASLRIDVNHSRSGDTLVIHKDEVNWFETGPQTKVLWSLSAIISRKFSDNFSLSLGLARSARSADMQERYIKFLATGYDKYDYLGNPDLCPEINYQVDLNFDYSVNRSKFYLNLFRSDVRDYIYGTLVPPSVARPVSMGAPGVKQFNNIDHAVFMGFESGVTSELSNRFSLDLSAGYTYAFFPVIEKIILENGQYSGTTILKSDPIAEIPALESLVRIGYEFPEIRLHPIVEIRAVAAQQHVSEAAYESSTPGYVIANISANYNPFHFLSFTAGIYNILDKGYYDHLNRKQSGTTGKLYEPGRTLFINMKIQF
jgi:iron complex outermembrane receptor protein